jgi:hypothetical protein
VGAGVACDMLRCNGGMRKRCGFGITAKCPNERGDLDDGDGITQMNASAVNRRPSEREPDGIGNAQIECDFGTVDEFLTKGAPTTVMVDLVMLSFRICEGLTGLGYRASRGSMQSILKLRKERKRTTIHANGVPYIKSED